MESSGNTFIATAMNSGTNHAFEGVRKTVINLNIL